MYRLTEHDISGILWAHVALNAPGQISEFRKAVRRTIFKKLKLVNYIGLGPGVVEFNALIKKVFRLHDPRTQHFWALLQVCALGDWRSPAWECVPVEGGDQGCNCALALRHIRSNLVPASA